MLHGLIDWLDAEKWRFWMVALSATAVWLVVVVAPWHRSRTESGPPAASTNRLETVLWSASTLLLLLAWRWPYLVGPSLLNPDESQMIAGAITLKEFPVFWKYVDGTTHGPLTHLALLVGNGIGIPLNYGGARFISGVLILGGFIIAGLGLMRWYRPRAVRIGLAPAMFLYASVAYYDFTGYTSETVSLFLILASIGLLVSAPDKSRGTPVGGFIRYGLAGVCLGALPFAKLQSVPAGLALGVIGLVTIVACSRPVFRRETFIALGSLVGGALTPAIVVAGYLWIWGLERQFWITYVENNLLYAGQGGKSPSAMVAELWTHMFAGPGMQTLAWSSLLVAVVAMALSMFRMRVRGVTAAGPTEPRTFHLDVTISKWTRTTKWLLLAWLLFAAASVAATISPARQYGHYLQFLVPPIALGLTLWIGELAASPLIRNLSRGTRIRSAALLLIFPVVLLVSVRVHRGDPDMHGLWTRNGGEWRSPAGLAIKELARPGDTLSVWGWMPYFHVEANLPHATREAHTYAQIMAFPLRDFYRHRYLRDFARSTPRLFVDSVGDGSFGFKDRAEAAHETFPELAEIIARDFQLVNDYGGGRIYVRKDDAASEPR